jgi:hypothetical protein
MGRNDLAQQDRQNLIELTGALAPAVGAGLGAIGSGLGGLFSSGAGLLGGLFGGGSDSSTGT